MKLIITIILYFTIYLHTGGNIQNLLVTDSTHYDHSDTIFFRTVFPKDGITIYHEFGKLIPGFQVQIKEKWIPNKPFVFSGFRTRRWNTFEKVLDGIKGSLIVDSKVVLDSFIDRFKIDTISKINFNLKNQ